MSIKIFIKNALDLIGGFFGFLLFVAWFVGILTLLAWAVGVGPKEFWFGIGKVVLIAAGVALNTFFFFWLFAWLTDEFGSKKK